MNEKKLAILGASGHGKVVADIAELNGYKVEFFDDAYPTKTSLEHWPVLGDTRALLESASNYLGVSVGIGNNEIRKTKLQMLLANNINSPALVHPTAVISKYSSLSSGVLVMAGAVINPFTKVGIGAIINTKAVVEHDCKIGNYVHICPSVSIAGGCEIDDYAWVGIGSSTKQCIKIGKSSILGAGSVIVKNIPADVIAYGNPAKEIKD